MKSVEKIVRRLLATSTLVIAPAIGLAQEGNVVFGSLHVPNSWSFDTLTNRSLTTPNDAYAWAQAKVITGSGGPDMQIRFLRALNNGVAGPELTDPASPIRYIAG